MSNDPLPLKAHSHATWSQRTLWMLALILLALTQVLWAGYRLGVGNQSIQIPFLQHGINPDLYARDSMVSQTLAAYPSYFFQILAGIASTASWLDVSDLYFWLHLLTALAVLLAAAALTRAMFKDRTAAGAGLIVILLLLAGHHRALAGDDLYSPAFTHTWAVFPLAILALALLYRGWALAAFALVGAIFNLHALMAGYLAVMFAVWAVCDRAAVRWYKLPGYALIFLLLASPTLNVMANQHQVFTAQWMELTRLRSADHSFPSSWWQDGNADMPRFALLLALGALSQGFAMPQEQRRKSLLLAAGAGLLFVVGYLFTEIWPQPEVVRAQLFRCSRLLLVIVFCHIAHGIVQGWRVGRAGASELPAWRRKLEAINAIVVLLCVALPALLPLLPYAVLLGTLVALVNSRLAWTQALVAGVALWLSVAAARQIHFDLDSWWKWTGPVTGALGWMTLLAAVAAGIAARRLRNREMREVVTILVLALAPALLLLAARRLAHPDAADGWVRAQTWARLKTDPNALFLTPSQQAGFRIGSERAVVGEWRDGTQLYFDAAYGPSWWHCMEDLQPGLLSDATGRQLISRGGELEKLDDAALLRLAKQYDADYIVLPRVDDQPRRLALAYGNPQWEIYKPQIVDPPPSASVEDPQAKFMRDVVWPNIDKYRKNDARVQIVDTAGRPVQDLDYEIRQVTSDFHWSAGLNFFKVPDTHPRSDFKPDAVHPEELQRFPDLFNTSLIPFSGKWMYVEPVEGQPDYADLDAYVAWCTSHGIAMEYHFLSGYEPPWLLAKQPASVQAQIFLEHARDVVERYKGKIAYWQVVNEQHYLSASPAVFAEIRKIDPAAKLGISDCASFWAPHPERHPDVASLYTGLAEVRWLASQGVHLDFFAAHGHAPYGLWPTGQGIYATLDAFAKEGVRIHISEFSVPLGKPILGPGHKLGYETWNAQNQAEFYAWYYTVCFSHPAVDLINLWEIGPNSWMSGGGVLDEHFQPKPDFTALQALIKGKFMTNLRGKLPLDGATAFRGFHGGYELALTLPGGQVVKGAFAVKAGEKNAVRLVLDRKRKTLQSVPASADVQH